MGAHGRLNSDSDSDSELGFGTRIRNSDSELLTLRWKHANFPSRKWFDNWTSIYHRVRGTNHVILRSRPCGVAV
jgi:hypothetical protein